ncbi:MAG: alpha/beta hydrolase [Clostridia bacterium]|nr:alpha/beta hydrolase [Clostridia bacterium]MBR1704688.1 alpha/beta hydrolase [Clostridia bacterium]
MAVQKSYFTFPSASKENVTIQCVRWQDPEKAPIGVVQITHGLSENTEMFEDLAIFLAEHGYVCAGMDFLGHGRTVGPGCTGIAPDDTNDAIWKDMFTLYNLLREEFPDLPHFSYSHSMGSVMVRAFLAMYRDSLHINACFLSGDSALPSFLCDLIPGAHVIGKLISRYPKDLIKRQATYVEKNYGDHPPLFRRLLLFWLSFDQQNIKNYINSPYSGGANADFRHVIGFMTKAFSTFALGYEKGWQEKIPDETFLFHGCGHWDFPGLLGFGPKILHKQLKAAGKQTELKLYMTAMHEPHGERHIRDEFHNDVLGAFNSHNPLA